MELRACMLISHHKMRCSISEGHEPRLNGEELEEVRVNYLASAISEGSELEVNHRLTEKARMMECLRFL